MNGILLLASIAIQDGVPEKTTKAIEATSYADSLTRMLWVLAIMVVLLFAAGRFLPRFLGQRFPLASRGLIKVIERRPLEPRRSLCLVQVVDQFYLLGVTDQRIDVLAGGDFDPSTLEHLARVASDGSSVQSKKSPQSVAFVERLLQSKAEGSRHEPPIGGES